MKRTHKYNTNSNFKTLRKSVPRVPSNSSPFLRVFLILAILVVLVGIILYFRFATVGEAIKGQNLVILAPTLDLDLDQNNYVDYNFQESPSVKLFLTLSQIKGEASLQQEYNLTLAEIKDGFFKYIVTASDGSVLSTGLLNDLHAASGPLFLNDDLMPDLQLEMAGDILEVTNLNYVLPEYSKIVMLNATMQQVNSTNKLFFNTKNDSVVYYFNVTSSKKPVVTAFWKGSSVLNDTGFSVVNFTDTSVFMKLNYTFTEDKPYVLVINATVDDKTTLQQYVFAVGNVVYVLDEADTSGANSPSIVVKKIDGQYMVHVMLRPTTSLQAFSLPCVSGNGVKFDALPIKDTAAVVYGYDKSVQQWKAGEPSEIDSFVTGKGYALKLKDTKESGFNYTCLQSGFEAPAMVDLTLSGGWNLVGIRGYTSQTVTEFMNSVVPQQVKCVVVLGKSECMAKQDSLVPGKAYWVKVN